MSKPAANTMSLDKTIKTIRRMTPEEMEAEGWEGQEAPDPDSCGILEFQNGSKLYPAADYEGNGPGVFFGSDKNGKFFAL